MYVNKFMRKEAAGFLDSVKDAWNSLSPENQRAIRRGGYGFLTGATGNLLLGDRDRTATQKVLDALLWGTGTGTAFYGGSRLYDKLLSDMKQSAVTTTNESKENKVSKQINDADKGNPPDVGHLVTRYSPQQFVDENPTNKRIRDLVADNNIPADTKQKLMSSYNGAASFDRAATNARIAAMNASGDEYNTGLDELNKLSDDDLARVANGVFFDKDSNQYITPSGVLPADAELPMGAVYSAEYVKAANELLNARSKYPEWLAAQKRLQDSIKNNNTDYLLSDYGLAEKQRATKQSHPLWPRKYFN